MAAQQVGARTDHRHQRHHQLLADRIDRRIGDLREVLLEVVVEQLGLLREHGNRRVGAHRADRIVRLLAHRLEEELDVLLGVAEGLLAIEEGRRIVGRRRHRRVGQVRHLLELVLGLLQPLLVRLGLGQGALQLLILDDAALLEVDQQHLARLQAPLAHDLVVGDRQHTRFRGHDDLVVVGHQEARRAQAVAVEGGADLAAVGEGDAGRAVPRLHQGGVIFVEGLALGIHQRIAGPRLGDQHHHGVRQRVAAGHQKLERVVDAGGVGLAVRDDRPHLVEVGADQVGLHRAPAGIHPVDVAAHRVDLAVMGDEAIGMRQPPGRKGIGREALMHQAERRLCQRIAEILIKALDLRGQQQALVDHGARGEGRHVELRQAGQLVLLLQVDQRVLGLLADGEDLALEGVLVGELGAAAHDRHADHRHALDHRLAQARRVGRHVAPAQELLALDLDEMLQALDRELPRRLVLRQEAKGDGVVAGRRQVDRRLARPVAQQGVGELNHAPCAIADQRVGADRAPVVEIDQDAEALAHDGMRLPALDVGHEADAAGVVLVARVVKPLFLRQIHQTLSCCPVGAASPQDAIVPGIISPAAQPGESNCCDAKAPVV